MPSVLITGANRGIGLAFVRGYAADGWKVRACCRHPEKAAELKSVAGDVTIHRMDVTDRLQVAGLARELGGEAIDVLINNAGIYGPRAPFGQTDFAGWEEVMAINVFAPLRMAEHFIEHVAASQRRLIVNMSSLMGSIAANQSGGSLIYRSSKAALNMVGRTLAADLKPRRVSVIQVHPGWVRTEMGGSEAPVEPNEAAQGLRKLLESAGPAESGRFFDYKGEELPW